MVKECPPHFYFILSLADAKHEGFQTDNSQHYLYTLIGVVLGTWCKTLIGLPVIGVVLGVRLPKMSRATTHTISTVVRPMVPAGAV